MLVTVDGSSICLEIADNLVFCIWWKALETASTALARQLAHLRCLLETVPSGSAEFPPAQLSLTGFVSAKWKPCSESRGCLKVAKSFLYTFRQGRPKGGWSTHPLSRMGRGFCFQQLYSSNNNCCYYHSLFKCILQKEWGLPTQTSKLEIQTINSIFLYYTSTTLFCLLRMRGGINKK